MALTTTEFGKVFQRDISQETDIVNTGIKNIRNGGCTVYALTLANASASHAYCSFKMYDHNGDGWVAGTTQPSMVIPCADNAQIDVDIAEGFPLSAGLTIAAATQDGTVLTTVPAGDLVGWFITA